VVHDSIRQKIFSFAEIYVLEDKAGSLTIEDVNSDAYTARFVASRTFHPVNDNRASTYWYRIKIRYPATTERDWVIEFFDQTIDHLVFYSPSNGGFAPTVFGDTFAFSRREIWHKNFVVNLRPQPDTEVTYFARVHSRQRADVLVVLRSKNWLLRYALNEYFLFGVFYGMILVFSFYNLLMFIAVRERHYLYYIFYLSSVGLYEMSVDGIGFQQLWPGWPEFNAYAPALFLYTTTLSTLIFSASLLNIRRENLVLYRLFFVVAIARTLVMVAGVVAFPDLLRFRFIEIPVFALIYLTCIFYYFFRKYRPARFLILAYTAVSIGVSYKVTQYLGLTWAPLGELSHYTLALSFIAEMLLLSFAISDKIRLLRIEKEQAQEEKIDQLHENQRLKDNLNKTLEEQVQLKTRELRQKSDFIAEQNHQLETANSQLELQAREIAKMNAILEKENIKLQHDVNEVTEARVLSKSVSYEEFCSLYPDDTAWTKFLADLKWRNGYTCRKCSGTSYTSGRSPESRRCTRCGYDESAIAHTILKNTHLPIGKVLYMVFLIYNSQGTISSHRLSHILGIRQSTCWAYSAKIKGRLKDPRQDEKSQQSGWHNLILAE